ncbi:MAG: hypothetical protein ACERKN_01325 [Velocimicrobium sp.]
MNKYEELLQEASDNGLTVEEKVPFDNLRIKGLYVDGTIALNRILEKNCERYCVLAEELGHHATSDGNILDCKRTDCIKQERKARVWAYDKTIALKGIIGAYEKRCSNLCEMADYLGVSEPYLNDALSYYKEKFGIYAKYNEYTIYFEPTLSVYKNLIGNPPSIYE